MSAAGVAQTCVAQAISASPSSAAKSTDWTGPVPLSTRSCQSQITTSDPVASATSRRLSSVLGKSTSSESRNTTNLPDVAARPRLRAAETPRFGPLKTRTAGSNRVATPREPSVEPSSTTTMSTSTPPSCATALSIVSANVPAALWQGTITLIAGLELPIATLESHKGRHRQRPVCDMATRAARPIQLLETAQGALNLRARMAAYHAPFRSPRRKARRPSLIEAWHR